MMFMIQPKSRENREVKENKPQPFQQAAWEDPIAVPHRSPTLVCSQNLVKTAFIPQKLIQDRKSVV